MSAVSDFAHAYVFALLWSERDMGGPEDDDTPLLTQGYTVESLTDKSANALRREAVEFYWRNRRTLRAAYALKSRSEYGDNAYTPDSAGHDLYFTQAGHGVGFWSRDLGDVGDALSKACGRREFSCWINEHNMVEVE